MLHNLLRRLTLPGAISSTMAQAGAVAASLTIFAADLATAADIRLHVLYVFPLVTVALHCERLLAAGLLLPFIIILQVLTFSRQESSLSAILTDTLVSSAAALLAIGLARGMRSNHLHVLNLANRDALTNLLNRRSFEKLTDREISRQRRHGGLFSLAVVDIDDFKKLNDSQGHHFGDLALKGIARILVAHTRQSDAVARIGGDEFAILMPQTDLAHARQLCAKLERQISCGVEITGYPLSASIGCACFEQAPPSTSEALKQADQHMYQAKAAGKTPAVTNCKAEHK
ncbi:MAG: GGDEF domain-containing protein [Rhodocyclales bacterium GT-UBC]|nr:MAG: GGDEF domain-containing protein [Rhodocyclales bacterium GT-UBC]